MAERSARQKIERERQIRARKEEDEYLARRQARPTTNWLDQALASAARYKAPAREAALQVDAAIRGAADTLSFGLADDFAGAMDSLVQTGDFSRAKDNLRRQEARDRYDAEHRTTARTVGQVAGVLVPLAGGPLRAGAAASLGATKGTNAGSRVVRTAVASRRTAAASKRTARLPGAAPLSPREAAALAAAGGMTDVTIQHLADGAAGRAGSWRNDVGAFAGGAAGVAALPLGPARAGAVNGAVASMTQDLLHGRSVDWNAARSSAATGALFGGVGGGIGTRWSDGLSFVEKGRLGQGIGAIRAELNGFQINPGPKRLDRLPGAKVSWYPDDVSGNVKFEYKFGPTAQLSKGQTLAQIIYGPNFKLYHTLPSDVGGIFSIPTAATGRQLADDRLR